MINYAKVKDFWHYLDKYKDYAEFTDINSLTGGVDEYQRLFALDEILQALPNGGRMVEMRGGLCSVMSALLKRYPQSFECWSVDPLEGKRGPTFEQASKSVHKRIKLVRETFGNFSSNIPDSYFDLSFSISALESVPIQDWESCFRDIMRVSKPSAIIFHTITIPVDYPLAYDRLYKARQLSKSLGLRPVNLIDFEIEDVLNDPDTFYVSPSVFTRWLQHMPEGENTLSTGKFKRTTAFNVCFRNPLTP